MAMNQDMVGFSYPPLRPYVVSAEKIRDFAVAIGDDNPAYLDKAQAQQLGYSDVVAPPTFPIVLTMESMREAFDDPRLGMDFSRVVHGDQRFAYSAPIVAGMTLICTTTIDEIRSLGGNDFVTLRSSITSSGVEVCSAWSKLIVRGED